MLAVCVIVFIYIAIGMKWYARVQKACFYMGVVGLVIVFGILLFGNKDAFAAALNTNLSTIYGLPQMDYYNATIAAGQAAGATFGSFGVVALGASMAMVPMMTFFNLWPNWGSTLYGEVRGASDYKRNFWGMAWAIIVTTVLGLIFLALINKTMGWDFYINANGAFWSNVFYGTEVPIPVWPYPVAFAAFMTGNRALQILIVFLVGMMWFGWSGTVFLSSTRVIFAAALDRMLPEWVSKIQPGTKTPVNALLLMVIPSIIVSYLYAYNIVGFKSVTLDATLVIAITFFGTTLAAILLPWRQKEIFDGSPIAKYMLPSWLGWVTTALFTVISVYLVYLMYTYGVQVFGMWGDQTGLTKAIILLITLLSLGNVGLLGYVVYFVGKKVLAGDKLPVMVGAGLVFFAFLDWLLVVWFWDPGYLYGIGWQNSTSMVFMIAMYVLAAAIYFGFSYFRKSQGIDVDKVYKEIPVE
jgi:amino acid transporter